MVGSQLGPGDIALGLPLNSPFTAGISQAITTLQMNGVIDELIRNTKKSLNQCPPKATSFYQLRVTQFIGLWWVQGFCIVLGMVLLVFEIMRGKLKAGSGAYPEGSLPSQLGKDLSFGGDSSFKTPPQ